MLDILGEKLVEGLLLVRLDLKVNVAMTVLSFAEGDLVVKVSLAHRLLVCGKYLLNEVLGQAGDRLPLQTLFPFSVLLCLLLEILGLVMFVSLRCSLIHKRDTSDTH